MTSLHLLLWIAGGVLLQIAMYLGLVLWRQLGAYRALRVQVSSHSGGSNANFIAEVAAPKTAAWTGLRSFTVERKTLEDTSGQVCSFYLAPLDGKPLPPFLPGQFLTFALEIPDAQGQVQTVVRCYSLSDAPQTDRYRISVKRAPAPVGSAFPAGLSSNYLHDSVNVGSQLQVRAPAGHFHVDRSDAPIVLIGGGVGITPMLSMLNWCLVQQPGREVWLFYGVRNRAELVVQSHLVELAAHHPNFQLHLCLSDPQTDELSQQDAGSVHTHHSRVDVGLLRRLLPLKPYHFYICGPTPMLQSLVPALEDWGVSEARIHFEAFGPASISRKSSAAASAIALQDNGAAAAVVVTFAKSGKQETWKPGMGSLLDFAQDHGIAVDSGCRAGGCGSCQTSIQSGEVAYTQVPDFDPELGSCLLCVCTPKTALTLEA